ncbi:hypothetical protein Back2_27880 [Nocardioides baekrokdamisoli]|uniref:Peptidase S1 domain-containing protein n=1 Tax=Nocardioides baekrokdamisoli TaxID=1804624 RepID=A0A3G9IXT4_9ACTN|nr:trypsin-like serine protease [Nocardioides baekrokdamisoli]BBH18501.1 hypothetical protein Back2_27880 [Nocardioides baekrokdamisoli]
MTRLRVLAALLASAVYAVVPASARASTAYAPDGVLFYPSLAGLLPALGGPHFCSATVVHSAGHDLVITAAHCVFGAGPGTEFVPGFRDGRAPYGVWSVASIHVDPGWQSGQNPTRDVAVLTIAPLNGRQVEDVVGARPLGLPVIGAATTVRGYPMTAGVPSACTSRLTLTAGFPTVACPAGGMTDGVSGGAFVQSGRVVGVIGGLQQGGCTATVNYSSPFGAWTSRLLNRAQAHAAGDLALPGFLANACP